MFIERLSGPRYFKTAVFGWLSRYIYTYHWPSAKSRWLDIGQVLFLRFYGPRRSRSRLFSSNEKEASYIQKRWCVSGFSFSSSIPSDKSQNIFFTVTENTLWKKTFTRSLGLAWHALAWRNCIAGKKRAIVSRQYRPILPARVANQDTELAASYPLAELAR